MSSFKSGVVIARCSFFGKFALCSLAASWMSRLIIVIHLDKCSMSEMELMFNDIFLSLRWPSIHGFWRREEGVRLEWHRTDLLRHRASNWSADMELRAGGCDLPVFYWTDWGVEIDCRPSPFCVFSLSVWWGDSGCMPLHPEKKWNPSIWLGRPSQCGANRLSHGEIVLAVSALLISWPFLLIICTETRCQTDRNSGPYYPSTISTHKGRHSAG